MNMTMRMNILANINYWYRFICLDENLDKINDAIEYFEEQLSEAREDVKIKGNLEQSAQRLPALFEYRYAQFQEVEAIVKHLNIELDRTRAKMFKKYTEHYNKELTPRVAERYIDGDDEVVAWTSILNSFALIRNQYSGLLKSMDHKNWQISNIVKLRMAGLEDAML